MFIFNIIALKNYNLFFQIFYMEPLDKKELVISLIKDNLINLKLVSGLNHLGLIADDYCLHLGDTIFKLMGFEASEQNDLIFETVFVGNSEKVCQIDFSTSLDELNLLSMTIYDELLFAKKVSDRN
jgi:hypothetical protein